MYNRILELCKKKKITVTKMCADNSIPISTYQGWNTGRHTPSNFALKKIADYFGVSLPYLKYGTETSEAISEGEKLAKMIHDRDFIEHVIKLYELSDEDKERAFHLISMLRRENDKKFNNDNI